jgi:curved DNA-binding protein CbpA
MRRDFYRVLGVHPSSEDIVIRAAYRVLAQRYHPDRCSAQDTGALARMQEINEAYAVLSDHERRREYDEQHGIFGTEDFSGACAEPGRRGTVKTGDFSVSHLRNRARLEATFLAVQELQRRVFQAGRIISVA